MQHHSQSMELVCLVNKLNTSVGDRHYFPSGALIPDHTLVLCQSRPELGGNLQRHCPPGETQSLELTAPPQSQPQAASLLRQSLISYAHLLCLSILPVPGRRYVFPPAHSQVLLAGQAIPYLGSWCNGTWGSVAGRPQGWHPGDLLEPISWLL